MVTEGALATLLEILRSVFRMACNLASREFVLLEASGFAWHIPLTEN